MSMAAQPPLINPTVLVGLLILAILVASTIEVTCGPLKITFRKRRRRKRR